VAKVYEAPILEVLGTVEELTLDGLFDVMCESGMQHDRLFER
jgi:hypothetical protein